LVHATAPPSRFRSFPAYMPVGSLDKAFHCGQVKIDRVHIVRTALSKKASDHLPLLLEFGLKRACNDR
jgi:endonuclease/exonuclease/phosphatase family metal-dependent hydrolase